KIREFVDQKTPLTVTLASGESASLVPLEHFELIVKGVDGWAAIQDMDTVVGIDTNITDALKKEGQAREVVRSVQNARKDAGLEMEDRIELYLATESAELRQAIEAHRPYIMSETLATKWATQPLGNNTYITNVKVDGQPLTIELRKVAAT